MNSKLVIALASLGFILALTGASYAVGRSHERAAHAEANRLVMEEAQAKEQQYAEATVAWEQERADLMVDYRKVDDVESIEWGAVSVPDCQRNNRLRALGKVPTHTCRTIGGMPAAEP